MTSLYIISILFCVAIININATDLEVGSSLNSELIHMELVKLSSIPLKTRVKNVFYNNGTTVRTIKGITAIDLDRSKATAIITSGGVGSTFTNIRLKSEKGSGLNYQIQIFA